MNDIENIERRHHIAEAAEMQKFRVLCYEERMTVIE